MYSHVICLTKLGQIAEAKRTLDEFSEEADDFVGEIEVADVYVELGYFHQAIQWFEKGWNSYWRQPDWVSRYIYSLHKVDNETRAQEILNEAIQQKSEELQEASEEVCDEDWTEIEKENHIEQLRSEIEEYGNMIERISKGYIPLMKFDTSIYTACYLFGCKRHNHPEYK
jgi:DNA repair exonuclease SbcCD ATPase subunit